MCDSSVQNTQALLNLSKLLNNDKSDSSDDDDAIDTTGFTPASIGAIKKTVKTKESPYTKPVTNPDDIWDSNEVQETSIFTDDADRRPQPEYDIAYKQKVTAEDMFLGMSGKNQSTACCEDMIIKIKLPQTTMKHVELDVKDTFLVCRTPKYRLLLPLPHPVDSKNGQAKWNGQTETLEVILKLQREYDFINFQ